jgi:hypothetical protein
MLNVRMPGVRAGKQAVLIQLAKLEAAKGQKVTVVCSSDQAEALRGQFTPEELQRISFHTPVEVTL